MWDLQDEDPWHLRIQDLHRDMLDKFEDTYFIQTKYTKCVEHTRTPGPQYIKYSQYNPIVNSEEISVIDYVIKQDGLPLK